MKSLEVTLNYASGDASLITANALDSAASMPFPFRVVDAYGGLLAEGAVNSRESTRIQFEDPTDSDILFVRLVWPTGKATTKMVDFAGGSGASVNFTDEAASEEDWAKWAAPRVPLARPSISSSHVTKRDQQSVAIDRFRNVWLRLWTHSSTGWMLADRMPRVSGEKSATAMQVDLELGPGSHLLQIGGIQMPWVFVSIPSNGSCRVFITPNAAADAKNLPLKVVVTSFRPEAEMLVEFLSRDALRAADSVGQFEPVATKLLQRKFNDAVSAIAGAYYLLRVGRWRNTPLDWFDNLYSAFSWSADAALIRCVVSLRQGLRTQRDTLTALDHLRQGLERGTPLFEEGHRLLVEAHSLLRGLLHSPTSGETISPDQHLVPANLQDYKPIFEKCQALSAARAWTGPCFSYFGATPDRPSSEKVRGGPPKVAEEYLLNEPNTHVQLMFSGSSVSESLALESGVEKSLNRRKRKNSVTYLKDL